MRYFEPLLIDHAKLRVPGLQVLSFSVHRHLPEHASVEVHRHAWSQAIVYLSGEGVQTVGPAQARIEPGSLVVLAPGVPHAFARRQKAAPLSVMIDFRLRGARRKRSAVCSLNRSELAHIRQQVSHLLRLQSDAGEALKWEGAIPVLQVLLTVLRAAGWIERGTRFSEPKPRTALDELLSTLLQRPSLSHAIRESGYHRDHLNRLVKRQTGLTLGQYRAQLRLSKAKEMLQQRIQVTHVASAIGLPDQSYFARWFRRQTGQSPSDWTRTN